MEDVWEWDRGYEFEFERRDRPGTATTTTSVSGMGLLEETKRGDREQLSQGQKTGDTLTRNVLEGN